MYAYVQDLMKIYELVYERGDAESGNNNTWDDAATFFVKNRS